MLPGISNDFHLLNEAFPIQEFKTEPLVSNFLLRASFIDLTERLQLVDQSTRETAEWSLYVCREQNQIFFVDDLPLSSRLLQQLLSLRDQIHLFEAVFDVGDANYPAAF
jgi:hypothetical protein